MNELIPKLLLVLAARSGQEEALREKLPALAGELFEGLGEGSAVTALWAVAADTDPYRGNGLGQPVRGWEATIELRGAGGQSFSHWKSTVPDVCAALGDLVHLDLCALVAGSMRIFRHSEPMPLRLQYLMRRRADHTPEAYRRHYEDIHYQFGMQTDAIRSYVQFYADLSRSQELAMAVGFGQWSFDSVSELHIAQMQDLIEATADGELAKASGQDEERFIDRANSVMFFSEEIVRLTA